MTRVALLCMTLGLMALAAGCDGARRGADAPPPTRSPQREPEVTEMGEKIENTEKAEKIATVERIVKTDAEWRGQLTAQQYRVTRRKATERAFTGEYWRTKAEGVYQCVCCGLPLFASDSKFASGTGWPSFREPIDAPNITTRVDRNMYAVRTEVLCSRCDAHLGHVFADGPPKTPLRYCINSVSLKFVEKKGN